MNKSGDMTITKLVSIILGAVILILVIAGTITGGLKPLEEKISSQFDKIQLLFTKDKPTTGDCKIYSDNCPGGCRKINEENIKGDFSFCLDACYLKTIGIDEQTNVTYKYNFAEGIITQKINDEEWRDITDYATDENIRLQEIYDEMINGPFYDTDDTYLTKEYFDGKLYALKKPKVKRLFIEYDVFGGDYVLYIQENGKWKELPITKEGYFSDSLVNLRLFFEENCK